MARKNQKVSPLVMILAVVGVVYALNQKNKADKASIIAIEQKQNAQRSDSLAQIDKQKAIRSDSLAQIDKQKATQRKNRGKLRWKLNQSK